MSQLVHAPAPSRSLVRIRDAIGHCRHAGIAVKIGPLGVVRVGLHWELEPGAKTVSPVGAALIAWQPPIADQREAAALVIGCSPVTLDGIEDGLHRVAPRHAEWSCSIGYEWGSQLRVELLAPTGALRVVS